MSRVTVALGSNLGDRMNYLQQAYVQLAHVMEIQDVSSVFQTDPVGGPSQDPYLNAIVVGQTTLEPRDFLANCHHIEETLGRERVERWDARTIDIDLLVYDDLTTRDLVPAIDNVAPLLELPHPRAHERAFVLVPWEMVEPHRVIPGHGTVEECLARVDRQGVVVFASSAELTQVTT